MTLNHPWLQRLNREARANPGKAAVLGVLVLIMAGMWLRLLAGGDPSPRPAAAKAAVSPTAPTTDKQRVTVQVQPHLEHLQAWIRQPIKPLGRNFFAVELGYYRREGGAAAQNREEQGFWEELAKSRSAQTDQKRARQILIENLQAQAARLQLQSTMMGPNPKAMVNGKLVEVGNVVAVGSGNNRIDFRVVRIEARSMVVERDGILLAIHMK